MYCNYIHSRPASGNSVFVLQVNDGHEKKLKLREFVEDDPLLASIFTYSSGLGMSFYMLYVHIQTC